MSRILKISMVAALASTSLLAAPSHAGSPDLMCNLTASVNCSDGGWVQFGYSSFPECMREEYRACVDLFDIPGPLIDHGVQQDHQ